MRFGLSIGALAALAAAPAQAQFGNEWLEYSSNQGMLGPSSGTISNSTNEVDFAFDDLDQDGWTDLVVVRKQPFTTSGKRTNLLLMNENGVLTDRSAAFASSTDVGGDSGFMTETNDRDVVITDVNNDGWDDIVTATTLSSGSPKHVSHPRVYLNLGDAGGWAGLRFEDSRTPLFLNFGSGQPDIPEFCGVSAGDVTGNGTPDLYFADYGSMDNRLLINDGSGHYSDDSLLHMTTQMLSTAFGTSTAMDDFNQTGVVDVMKSYASNTSLIYNESSNEGQFVLHDTVYTGAVYHTNIGDLNNDGRTDLIIADDGSDRLMYNTGNDALDRVIFGPAMTFSFLASGDDGFGSDNYIVDLDDDGWNDALIADVDVDISGCSRRTHIYRNPGGLPGDQIAFVEERELSGGSEGPGWLGAVGLLNADLEGTHDAAVFDVDNDGDKDLVLGRCVGTFAFENVSGGGDCGVAQYGLGHGGANIATLTSASSGQIGTPFTVDATGFNGDGVATFVLSRGQAELALVGGTALIDLGLVAFSGVVGITGGSGSISINVPDNALLIGNDFFSQMAMPDASQPSGWALSSGISLSPCP